MKINPILPLWTMLFFIPLLWFCRSKNIFKMIRRIMILFFLFLINLRIMIPNYDVEIMNSNLDVLFVLDTTISMVAEDYVGDKTRLSAVKEDCIAIMEELDGAKFSIITFDNNSEIMLPYTMDKNILYETIDIINVPNVFYAYGSSLNTPIEDILKQLKSSSKNKDRVRIVFIFSDGEITNDEKLKSYSSLSNYIDDGAVLGYGTNKGGHMKVWDFLSEEYMYLEDKTSYPYVKALSKIDENNLKSIANDLKISYINMNEHSNINDKIEDIKERVILKFDDVDKLAYEDIYYIFVIPFLGLLIYELIAFRRGI